MISLMIFGWPHDGQIYTRHGMDVYVHYELPRPTVRLSRWEEWEEWT